MPSLRLLLNADSDIMPRLENVNPEMVIDLVIASLEMTIV